jgi:hypothetical protein
MPLVEQQDSILSDSSPADDRDEIVNIEFEEAAGGNNRTSSLVNVDEHLMHRFLNTRRLRLNA